LGYDDVADRWNKRRDKVTTKMSDKLKLEKLQKALDYAVENEKYEKAVEIKKLIDELKSE
jgi:protein-arginine kinase activator protein McsA